MANIMPFSLVQRLRSMNISGASSGSTSDTTPEDSYAPTPTDIVIVRIMLTRGNKWKLPPDIVDAIFDQAEYWAHSSNEIDFKVEHKSALRIVGRSRAENRFLIRSYPVGLTSIDVEKNLAEELSYDTKEAKALPLKKEHDPNFFAKLANYPTPKLVSPVRKVVFTTKSHDQGHGGDREHRDTYKHSWTWFEAGLEKFDADQSCGPDCTFDMRHELPKSTAPDLPVCGLRTLQPPIDDEIKGTYTHPLSPNDNWTIQRNKLATKNMRTHVVTWSYLDDTVSDSDDGMKLETEGRGRGTGDGSFVRDLRLGDVVTMWGKARFPAWVNHVEKVKIDIYWAV